VSQSLLEPITTPTCTELVMDAPKG